MRTIKAFAAVGLMSASAALAEPSLWYFPNLLSNLPNLAQVGTPGVLGCYEANPPDPANNSFTICYSQSGGNWYAYAEGGATVKDAVSGNSLAVNNGMQFQEWSTTENDRVYIKNKGLGNATRGIEAKLTMPGGTDTDPTIGAIAFDWRDKSGNDWEGPTFEDITSKNGLCLEYMADVEGVTVELGWDEGSYGFNTYVYSLPKCDAMCKVNLSWDMFALSYEAASQELNIALEEAVALKLAYKNKTADEVVVNFVLKGVGWLNECSGEDVTPVKMPTSGKIAAQFNLSGRMLSIANISAPTPVQVINMQGALVAQKTLGPNESLNLANMPTGVYMVRSAKLGISQKIVLK